MLKVGLTGGIGSGKSLVSEVFKRIGIPVFNADQESKSIVNTDEEVIRSLKEEFGNSIYNHDGIDRKKLAAIIFNNQDALLKVNQIIHPKVRAYFFEWTKSFENKPYVIEEAAILFESKANIEMDFTINVHADELVRVKRVIERDKVSKGIVESRISNQLTNEERITLADFTIHNNGDEMILPQILKIHSEILKSVK
jgi:dephospho-CoA kinase